MAPCFLNPGKKTFTFVQTHTQANSATHNAIAIRGARTLHIHTGHTYTDTHTHRHGNVHGEQLNTTNRSFGVKLLKKISNKERRLLLDQLPTTSKLIISDHAEVGLKRRVVPAAPVSS